MDISDIPNMSLNSKLVRKLDTDENSSLNSKYYRRTFVTDAKLSLNPTFSDGIRDKHNFSDRQKSVLKFQILMKDIYDRCKSITKFNILVTNTILVMKISYEQKFFIKF